MCNVYNVYNVYNVDGARSADIASAEADAPAATMNVPRLCRSLSLKQTRWLASKRTPRPWATSVSGQFVVTQLAPHLARETTPQTHPREPSGLGDHTRPMHPSLPTPVSAIPRNASQSHELGRPEMPTTRFASQSPLLTSPRIHREFLSVTRRPTAISGPAGSARERPGRPRFGTTRQASACHERPWSTVGWTSAPRPRSSPCP